VVDKAPWNYSLAQNQMAFIPTKFHPAPISHSVFEASRAERRAHAEHVVPPKQPLAVSGQTAFVSQPATKDPTRFAPKAAIEGSQYLQNGRQDFQPIRHAALVNQTQLAPIGHPGRVKQRRQLAKKISMRDSKPDRDGASASQNKRSLRSQRRIVFWEARASALLKKMPDWFLFSALGVVTREVASRDAQQGLDTSKIIQTEIGKDKAKSLAAQLRQNFDDKIQRALRGVERGKWGKIGRNILKGELEDLKKITRVDDILSNEILIATTEVIEAETWGRIQDLISSSFSSAGLELNQESAVDDLDDIVRVADIDDNGIIELDELYEYVVGVPVPSWFKPFARRQPVLLSAANASKPGELFISSLTAQEVKKLRQLFVVARMRYERAGTNIQLNLNWLKRQLLPDEFLSNLPDDLGSRLESWRDTPPTVPLVPEEPEEPDEKPRMGWLSRYVRKLRERRGTSEDQGETEMANMRIRFPDGVEIENGGTPGLTQRQSKRKRLRTLLEERRARRELAKLEREASTMNKTIGWSMPSWFGWNFGRVKSPALDKERKEDGDADNSTAP